MEVSGSRLPDYYWRGRRPRLTTRSRSRGTGNWEKKEVPPLLISLGHKEAAAPPMESNRKGGGRGDPAEVQ